MGRARLDQLISDEFIIRSRLKLMYALSPLVFDLVSNHIVREVTKNEIELNMRYKMSNLGYDKLSLVGAKQTDAIKTVIILIERGKEI